MVSRRVETLTPCTLDFLAQKTINKNARVSSVYASMILSELVIAQTHHRRERERCMRPLSLY